MKIHNMTDQEPAIEVDPASLVLCYVALPADLQQKIDVAIMNKVQKVFQPAFWKAVMQLKVPPMQTFGITGGELESNDVLAALPKVIALETHSVVLSQGRLSLDSGKTMTKIFAGFAYCDTNARIILPRDHGIVPLKQKRKGWLPFGGRNRRS